MQTCWTHGSRSRCSHVSQSILSTSTLATPANFSYVFESKLCGWNFRNSGSLLRSAARSLISVPSKPCTEQRGYSECRDASKEVSPLSPTETTRQFLRVSKRSGLRIFVHIQMGAAFKILLRWGLYGSAGGVTVRFLSFLGTFPIGYVSYCILMYLLCILS